MDFFAFPVFHMFVMVGDPKSRENEQNASRKNTYSTLEKLNQKHKQSPETQETKVTNKHKPMTETKTM